MEDTEEKTESMQEILEEVETSRKEIQDFISNIADLNDSDVKAIFASLRETKSPEAFKAFKDYVNAHKGSSISLDFEHVGEIDFNVGDENVLDFFIDNIEDFSYVIKTKIGGSLYSVRRAINREKFNVLEYLNETTLFLEYEPGRTVFEFLLDENILPPKALDSIYNNKAAVQALIPKIIEKDETMLKHFNGYLLNSLKVGEVGALEYLFQKNLVDEEVIKNIYSDSEVVSLCFKYKREDLLPFLRQGVLEETIDGKIILDILLDKGIEIQEKYITNKTLIEVFLRRKRYDKLMNISESSLLEKPDGQTTILETMLINGYIPQVTFLTEKESLDIFLKYRVYEKIKNYNIDVLLSLRDINETYLDYICEQVKAGMNFKISQLQSIFINDDAKKAAFYITIARHGLSAHIDDISEYDLTRDNGSLIKELLSQDKELTMSTILPLRVREKFKIAVLLRMYDADQKEIKIDLHSMGIIDSYFEQYNSQFGNLELDEEGKALIEEFKSVMLADDLSDPKLIDAYVTSYTYLLATHNIYGANELKKIIEIKRTNPNFCIVYEKNNSFYREATNSVHLETSCLSTLNHETGHALYHNLTDGIPPVDYGRLVYEIRSNPEMIGKIGNYSRKFHEIKDRIYAYVDEKYMKDYHLTDEEMASLDEFLEKQKEEKKKDYLDKGYDEKTIDTILNGIFSKEEYLEQDRRIKREELVDAVFRTEYGAFIALGDIIDAVYGGQFKSNELRNRDYNVIRSAYGHGIAYYERGMGWAFDETMANYSCIVKSENADEILNYLKEMFGEEFVNLISNYYTREITFSTKELGNKEERVA